MSLAPIVLFVYNRPDHTLKTLEALSSNYLANESDLYIFSDGLKNCPSIKDKDGVKRVRKVIHSKKWCKNVYIIERNENWGLAKSITKGVSQIVNEYDRVIVLEDDIVTSSSFLKYMNSALTFYEKYPNVMHIAGYMFPIENNLPSTFFYNANSCWGWATWKRAWKSYNNDIEFLHKNLLAKVNFTQKDYNKGQGKEFYYQLEQNLIAKMSTWAVRWHTSIYLKGGFCLHPNKSLVRNIGVDGSGQNSGILNFKINAELTDTNEFVFYSNIEENNEAIRLVKKHYDRNLLNKLRPLKRWLFR